MFQFFERLLAPFPAPTPEPLPRGLLPFVWAGTTGARGALLAMAALTAAIAAFEALLFAVLGRIVDWLSATEPAQLWPLHGATLTWIGVALVASIGLVALQTIVRHQTLGINLSMRLRWNYHRLMLGQSMAFYQDDFAGRITTKVMQTALAVRQMLFIVCDVMVTMLVYAVTVLILTAAVDLQMMWPFAIWLTCYCLSLAYFVPRLGRAGKRQADARSLMTGRVTDAYTNITTVKLFSHTHREAGYARQAMQGFLNTGYHQMRLVSAFDTVNHALSMALVAAMTGMGLWLWTSNTVGIGAIAAASALTLRLTGMSHWIMWEMTTLFEAVGTVQDGISTLSRKRAVVDAPNAVPLAVTRGEVCFDKVGFNYGKAVRDDEGIERPAVIDELTLTVNAGERVGLVGRSGAGKSTLVNLLLRFYDLQSGQIRIDGQDIAQVTQDSLRASIGMVSQDTSLLHRSLADNIAYGRPDATEAMILAAAERAQAADFIDGMSDLKGRRGLQAHVGERGVKLSGGQRQRIAIARVMLKDAPILLLDEATSALDSEVEAAIQESLSDLMQGKTVIAIAHRLSTIAAMDRLIIIDNGRIVEQGDHQGLLAQGGIYARLWARQSGGFLAEDTPELAA